MNNRLRLRLVKKSITEELKKIKVKEFLKLGDPAKFELFTLFRYLVKGK